MLGRLIALAAACTTVLSLAACTETKVGPTTYVTVHATPSAPPSSPATSATSSAPGRTASAVIMRKLPGTCDDLLPMGSVIDALGHNVTGRTVFVVGLPDRSIGRVSYINCQYGVPKTHQVAKIEIQVSLYRTAQKAAARIQPTVDDYLAHGAHASKTEVAGHPATVLTGGQGTGYGPTIVAAVGQRTIVVTLRPQLYAAATIPSVLTKLATLAEQRTGR